jgi:murein DD-endopeptidase MepM/ murein hydrolase activator NlpD
LNDLWVIVIVKVITTISMMIKRSASVALSIALLFQLIPSSFLNAYAESKGNFANSSENNKHDEEFTHKTDHILPTVAERLNKKPGKGTEPKFVPIKKKLESGQIRKDGTYLAPEAYVKNPEATDVVLTKDPYIEQKSRSSRLPQTSVSGTITNNTTWSVASSPYVITGNVFVMEPATLTIEPGVVVKFQLNTSLYIYYNATLNAVGTDSEKIIRKKIEADKLRTQIKTQEDVVKLYLRAMQEDIDQSAIELLLSSESFAHAVDKVSYLETVKEEGASNIEKLNSLQEKLNRNLDSQKADEQSMIDLKATIDEQAKYLQDQRREKAFLMVRTKGQQDLYEKLLAEAYQKRADIEKEMEALVAALALIGNPAALDELGPSPYPVGAFGPISPYGFIWPVPPEKVTSYFQDPDYLKLFGFNHDAVDLRSSQGTEVHAASDGVVYAAKDNGMGYSFVVLVHRDGFSTVYGHLSDIQVREGQAVHQGDVIGLSGGAVGTRGAGYYTTGPHLHFEVRLRGVPKDPLVYLP